MKAKLRGYASVFGNRDLKGTVIDRGAFSKWLGRNARTSLSLYWNHEYMEFFGGMGKMPIGATTTLRQNARGLYYEAELLSDARTDLLVQLLGIKGRTGASFAFRNPGKYLKDEVWHLNEVSPLEITVTDFPANPRAYTELLAVDEGKPKDQPQE